MTSSELFADENKAGLQQPMIASTVKPDLPNVVEHACYCFYAVQPRNPAFPPQFQRTLADLIQPQTEAARQWIPDAARQTITGERRQQPVWTEAPLEVGTDLHPHIRRLLSATDGTDLNQVYAYRLSDPARRLLSGQWLSYPPELPAASRTPLTPEIRFGATARQRLARRLGEEVPCALLLRFEECRLVFFRTGLAFLIMTITAHRADDHPLHPYWLVEALSSLARINTLVWRSGDTVVEDPKMFSLGDIVRSLAGGMESPRAERRTFTASYLQFTTAPDPQAARRLAVQLCRHYTDHYRLTSEAPDVCYVTGFENILHAFCLEGCATLMDPTPPPGLEPSEFLKNYRTVTYERHYIPLMLLAFHEFTHLLYLTNDASFWPDLTGGKPDPVDRLQQLRDRILKFQLCYRFTYVSYLSLHNAVNQALRRALGLDWMLAELNQDTQEIDAYLQRMTAERTARRFRWASTIGGAAVTWLTAFAIVKELLEVLHMATPEAIGIIAIGIGLTTALVAGWVTWARTGEAGEREHGNESSHLARHAVEEQIKHRVLNKE